MIPDTDAERVSVELNQFNRRVGPEILRLLTDGVQRRKSGWLRMFVNLKDGQIVASNATTDFAIDLDAASG